MSTPNPEVGAGKATAPIQRLSDAIKHQEVIVLTMKSSIEARGKRLAASSDYQYEFAFLSGLMKAHDLLTAAL